MPTHRMSQYFVWLVTSALTTHINEIYRVRPSWAAFKKALKEEYSLEDLGMDSRRTFCEWIHKPNKGLVATKLL